MQLIKTTNRCHVSLSMLETRGLLWQWGLCVIPGCQPVCPRVLFLSNLHLTFRLTALLSHFSWLISFEEIIFELQHRLTVSDDTTDTTHRYEFWQNASHDAYGHWCVLETVVFDKLTTNRGRWAVCLYHGKQSRMIFDCPGMYTHKIGAAIYTKSATKTYTDSITRI